MTNATPTGYGPRHRGLIFDGDESKYELWEIKFLGFMRLRKLSDTIDPISDDARGELPAADEANNADAFAELIQCLDDRSLSLIMREARDDGRKAIGILREHYLGRSKPRIIGLYHALCSLNMNNETTTDYILRAEQAAAALKTAGEEVSDALLIAMIIKGLPHTFSTFSALTSQKTDEPSVTEFKVALRSYEETMKARGGTTADDDQVFYTARANANSPNRRQTCDNCGKVGHKSANCWRKSRWCLNCKSNTHDTKYCRRKNARTVTANTAKYTECSNDSGYSFMLNVNADVDAMNTAISMMCSSMLVDCGSTSHIVNDESMFLKFDDEFVSRPHRQKWKEVCSTSHTKTERPTSGSGRGQKS